MAHGFHFYEGAPLLYRLLYYSMERMASRWTDGLIVLNREDLLAARGFGLIEGKNLFLVHGVGVDLDEYSLKKADRLADIRIGLRLLEDAPVVTCIAELIPRKNHLQLFEAWVDVHREFPRAVLLVAGTGELEQQLRREADGCRFEGSIRMLGYRTGIPDLLAISDVVVLASRHEGLPRVVMEAMAAARPVVATDVRGNRDLVWNGKSGLLVPLRKAGPAGAGAASPDRRPGAGLPDGSGRAGNDPGVCVGAGAPGDGRYLLPVSVITCFHD